ncbi:hypothetical protein EDB19DRAFT_1599679, partial [Suillus lakei]
FKNGLDPALLNTILCLEVIPNTILGWYNKATTMESQFQCYKSSMSCRTPPQNNTCQQNCRGQNQYHNSGPYYTPKQKAADTMDIDQLSLSPEEYGHRKGEGLCFNCGIQGHCIAVCPKNTSRSNQGPCHSNNENWHNKK